MKRILAKKVDLNGTFFLYFRHFKFIFLEPNIVFRSNSFGIKFSPQIDGTSAYQYVIIILLCD